jgi:hypothetical protein
MRLFNPSKGAKDASAVAIFDVGSGSIGVALAILSKTAIPNIIWTKRIPITFQKTVEFEKLSRTMLSTLLDLSLELQSDGIPLLKQLDGPKRLDDVMFAFASPWYSTQAKVYNIEKNEPFELTHQFIRNLLKREESEFRKGPKFESAEREQIAPVLIERQVIQTSLNGYVVSNPYKKPVKSAQIDLVLSAIPSYIYEKASDIKTQLVHRRDGGHFNSFILPAFIVTRDIFHNSTSFLLMDISAEVTDIATINKGTIVDATSFPHGKYTVIREVAARLNTVPEEASSMLAGYMEGETGSVQAEQITNILRDIKREWLSNLRETLEKISREAPLPRNLYLTADEDYGEWYRTAIGAANFGDFALSKAPFNVKLLNSEILSKYVTHSRLTSEMDPFLTLETLYMQRVLYEQGMF